MTCNKRNDGFLNLEISKETVDISGEIKIACHDVRIIPWDHREASTRKLFAQFTNYDMSIRIDRTITPVHALEALIHEINHAIWFIYGIYDGDNEERICGNMATAWAQILRDNADLHNAMARIMTHCNWVNKDV